MKERLLYLTIGLLIGIVVMQWTNGIGARAAQSTSGIVGIVYGDVLDENGAVWRIPHGTCWTRLEDGAYDAPIPVSQIKLWSLNLLITNDNVAWTTTGNGWVNCGPWPGSPVPTDNQSWGGLKGKYKQEGD